MKMTTIVPLCVALLFVTAASALPSHWYSYYGRPAAELFARNQQQQCKVEEAAIGCRTARLVHSNGHYSHVHICPVDSSNPLELCYNSQLPRCCPGDVGGAQLTCVTRTNLKFGGEVVEVSVHLNSTSGQHCIAFDDAHKNIIESCCEIEGNGLQHCKIIPEPPECVKQRDIYFVVDSTDSIGDDIFCRFGYVLQLIVAAINPRGLDGARVASVLYRHDRSQYPARYLFNLADQCGTIVSNNIRQVVYEYYGVEHLNLARDTLTYPNVRADQTLPNTALNLALESIVGINDRPASVITLTDGKSHQDTSHLIAALRPITDVIIAAGIGQDLSVDDLLKLATNSSTVVHEPNRNKPIDFGIKIVETMRATAALCTDEADRILTSLRAATESNLNTYCSTCMWKTDSQLTSAERTECSDRQPTCGARNLVMQSFDDVPQRQGSNTDLSDWEKLMLRGEIEKAVEDVIARIEG